MNYYIHYNGGKIYYSDSGEGEAIILLHGYLESSEVWSEFAGKLAGRFRVINVDLPGHGLSSVYGQSHTMEFMADAIRALIDNLNISKVFITGHSLGGYVALAFLELFAERLTGYCLFHSHPFADSPDAVQKREREINIVRAGKKYLMYPDNVLNMFASENLEQFAGQLERSKQIASRIRDEGIISVLNGMMIRSSRVHIMEQGEVPCLWILGRKDFYIPCDSVQSGVKLPYNAKVIILENSGHLGFIEEESKALEAITAFAELLPSGR